MRVTMIMMMVVLVGGGGACGASDGGGECGGWWASGGAGGAPPSDAWRGAVAACRRAPACPHATTCDDPRWAALADWALDEIATCFAGPCEERAACIAASMPPAECARDP